MEYKQYITEHNTEIGLIRLEYNYNKTKDESSWSLDADMPLIISVNNKVLTGIPKFWASQTSSTILRKVCNLVNKTNS